jgi:transcriptional regulator with XRE-family HTH domain
MLVHYGTYTVGNEAYKKFRVLLVEARKRADLTQSELSVRLKRPQSFVSKYERGERRLDVIEFGEVARAIGIDPISFLRKLYSEGT